MKSALETRPTELLPEHSKAQHEILLNSVASSPSVIHLGPKKNDTFIKTI